jgi:hypothetical protein
MADAAGLVLRAPEFSDLASDEVAAAISDAALQVSSLVWGSKTDLGILLLAMHNLAISHPELGQTGPVTSERVGDLSRSYATPSLGSHELAETRYGRRFLALKRTVSAAAGPMVI